MKDHVYVISCPLGLVKLGVATNAKQRVQNGISGPSAAVTRRIFTRLSSAYERLLLVRLVARVSIADRLQAHASSIERSPAIPVQPRLRFSDQTSPHGRRHVAVPPESDSCGALGYADIKEAMTAASLILLISHRQRERLLPELIELGR
jgi:predicted GIY-YIG superfamily endonuclease